MGSVDGDRVKSFRCVYEIIPIAPQLGETKIAFTGRLVAEQLILGFFCQFHETSFVEHLLTLNRSRGRIVVRGRTEKVGLERTTRATSTHVHTGTHTRVHTRDQQRGMLHQHRNSNSYTSLYAVGKFTILPSDRWIDTRVTLRTNLIGHRNAQFNVYCSKVVHLSRNYFLVFLTFSRIALATIVSHEGNANVTARVSLRRRNTSTHAHTYTRISTIECWLLQ